MSSKPCRRSLLNDILYIVTLLLVILHLTILLLLVVVLSNQMENRQMLSVKISKEM